MEDIPQLKMLSRTDLENMRAVSAVLPFRVNEYVLQNLIDWSSVPDDPIFRMVFPQPGMLLPEHLSEILHLIRSGASVEELRLTAGRIRLGLNAHPAGQRAHNVPRLDGHPVPGLQHQYRETVLFFPAAGQSCHTFCTYCFRWSQFAPADGFRFESHETDGLVRYLRHHPEVTDVLITGGDPLAMTTRALRCYVEPLLDPELEHLRSIRLGTKSLSYWPDRFVSDADADDLLGLFSEIRKSGRHCALMAHITHPRELEPGVARDAIRRILETGAVIRTQSPVVKGVNDDANTWRDLWQIQVQLGMVPYYMFVARDTGAQHHFKVPLIEALRIYQGAYRQLSGLGRSARGPVMSASPGKVIVDGVTTVAGEEVFALKFIQGREPRWVGRPFFARFDSKAAWLDELRPAFGRKEFFFEPRFREIEATLESGGETRRQRLPWAGRPRTPSPGPVRSPTIHT